MREAVPLRRPSHMPDSHRGFRLRPTSSGRTRSCTRSPNSYPSPRQALPNNRSNSARPSWPTRCLVRSSPACSTNQE
eukprot:2958796-Alexandrium_andersonii.AAC.1